MKRIPVWWCPLRGKPSSPDRTCLSWAITARIRNPGTRALSARPTETQTGLDWASFLKHHNLVHSMSRRGNCHDNAVAESFFNLLKRERIRRKGVVT